MQSRSVAPAGVPTSIGPAPRHLKESLSFSSEAPLRNDSAAPSGSAGVHASGGATHPADGSQTRHCSHDAPLEHTPAAQRSPVVHGFPSSQEAVFAACVHTPAALQTSSVHTLWSEVHALPAASSWQVALQQSPSSVLPSSQVSPAVTTPLPHPVGLQFASQPSPLVGLPSSQASSGASMPSPQRLSTAPMSQLPPKR